MGKNGCDVVCTELLIYGSWMTITLMIDGVEGVHKLLLIDDFSRKHGYMFPVSMRENNMH